MRCSRSCTPTCSARRTPSFGVLHCTSLPRPPPSSSPISPSAHLRLAKSVSRRNPAARLTSARYVTSMERRHNSIALLENIIYVFSRSIPKISKIVIILFHCLYLFDNISTWVFFLDNIRCSRKSSRKRVSAASTRDSRHCGVVRFPTR